MSVSEGKPYGEASEPNEVTIKKRRLTKSLPLSLFFEHSAKFNFYQVVEKL
jgi:hypothetical protein